MVSTGVYINATGFPNTTVPQTVTKPIGHSLSLTFAIFAATSFSFIIVASIISNAILVSTIVSVKKLHSIPHVFIVNLAISDLITVIGTIPFDVDFMLRGYFPHGIIECGIMQTTFLIYLPSSILNLSLLTAERLITVRYPFQSNRYLTKSKVAIAVSITWAYTISVALFPMLNKKNALTVSYGVCNLTYDIGYDIFMLVANFLIPLLFIIFANINLFCISNIQATKMSLLRGRLGTFVEDNSEKSASHGFNKNSNNNDNNNNSGNKKNSLLSQTRRKSMSLTANLKAAKRIALLVGVFCFCWLTFFFLVVTNVACGVCHPRELTWVGNIVNYSTTVTHPLLYGILNTNIRREVNKKIRRLLGKYSFRSLSESNSNQTECFVSEFGGDDKDCKDSAL